MPSAVALGAYLALASTHDLVFMITVASCTRTGYEVEDRVVIIMHVKF
jgi:hypothetical protein